MTLCNLYNFAFLSHSPIPAFATSDIDFSSSATKRKIDPAFQEGERVRLSWIPTNEDPLILTYQKERCRFGPLDVDIHNHYIKATGATRGGVGQWLKIGRSRRDLEILAEMNGLERTRGSIWWRSDDDNHYHQPRPKSTAKILPFLLLAATAIPVSGTTYCGGFDQAVENAELSNFSAHSTSISIGGFPRQPEVHFRL